jgi:hypothetical protein
VKCPAWDGAGVGYHTLFPGRWDKRNASCPGPDRIKQFNAVLVPWMAAGAKEEVPDMQLSDKVEVSTFGADGKANGLQVVTLETLFNRFNFVYHEVLRQRATDAAQTAALQALAASQGLDAAAVTKAVADAVDAALADLTVTLTARES